MCFATRSCARFSPTTSTPTAARTCISSIETYFVAATMVTDGPTSALIRSYRSRTSSGDTREHSLYAARLPVAAMGEEQFRVARRAEVEALDARDARIPQRQFRRTPQIESAVTQDLAPETRAERVGDVVSHVVATRTDRRAHRGCERSTERRSRALDDSRQQPAPTDVEHGDRRCVSVDPRQRDRHAVGAHREDGQVGLVRPEAVAGLAPRTGPCTMHKRRVQLVVEREPLRVCTDLCARAPAVLVDALDVVARLAAEIQRRVRPYADAADARREDDLVRARRLPAQVRHASRSFARSSSHSLRFRPGSSTTSSRSSDRTLPSSGPSR